MSSSSSQIAVYARIRRNTRFTELVAKRQGFATLLSVIVLVIFYGFFMVVGFNLDAELFKEQYHFGARILERVGGGNRKIALLGAQLVTEARAIAFASVPVRLMRFDFVEAVIGALVKAHAIEHEVLELGTEIGRVADPGSF